MNQSSLSKDVEIWERAEGQKSLRMENWELLEFWERRASVFHGKNWNFWGWNFIFPLFPCPWISSLGGDDGKTNPSQGFGLIPNFGGKTPELSPPEFIFPPKFGAGENSLFFCGIPGKGWDDKNPDFLANPGISRRFFSVPGAVPVPVFHKNSAFQHLQPFLPFLQPFFIPN